MVPGSLEERCLDNGKSDAGTAGKEEKMRYLTFALAKGRLARKAMELFREFGITSA